MKRIELAKSLGRNSQLAADGRVVADCRKPFAATHLPDQLTKAMSEICIQLSDIEFGEPTAEKFR